MSKSHWALLALVATMVCNGDCRPREVEFKNIYPVYRSEKEVQLGTPNRYEKPYKGQPDDGSVTYHRIDIPHQGVNELNATGELAVKNNSKSVIDYVPVALTIKRPNIKKWPSDQNGIESPDDLSLYNVYTNNINPLNPHHMTTPGYNLDFHYTSHSKPSILIVEELTTRRPFYDYDSVYTQPIQVLDRPPPAPPQSHPTYVEISQPHPSRPIYDPSPSHVGQNQYYPIPQNGYETTTPVPPSRPHQSSTSPHSTSTLHHSSTPLHIPSTSKPETTTKKRKTSKCPSVSVTATTSINNSNKINKEGCQDINIHISTNVNNSNTGLVRPNGPGNSSVVVVQNDQSTQNGGFGLFDVVWSIISRIFSFAFLNPSGALSPFPAFFTGLSAFILPWLFPHLLLQSAREQNRVRILASDGTGRYSEELHPQFSGWRPEKKISSSPPTSELALEPENANKTHPKINIESIATVARASSDGSPLPPPTALGHMLDTVSQLVESDIRTPPKLKEIIKEKANEHRKEVLGENSTPLPYTFIYDDEIGKFEEKYEATDKALLVDSSEGKASSINAQVATDDGIKGIAIPVVMDEDYEMTAPPKKLQKIPEVPKPVKEDKKKTAINKAQPTTTPSSGLSTWILLSDNKDATTLSPKKTNSKKEEEKKKAGSASTTKKPTKIQATTQKSTTQSTKKATAKPALKKPEAETTGISALEALVKNQKKASTTTSKPKPTEPKKKLSEKLEIAETKDKVEVDLPESKTTHSPQFPTTSNNDKSVTEITSQSSAKPTTESSVESTTKKKSVTKKKKKNKNRRKKPDTGIEAKIPSQPMGSQIYNFLSREIVPTVGLGLIGVALTAGLASFLGYNPFGSSTIPLRRTYETHHGYSPNNYYNYNTDYGDGGQSEEVLFREVLSGMPEDSRYGLTHADITYPEAYNRQDQVYDGMKNSVYPSQSGSMYSADKDMGSYDATYPQDYSTGYGATYDAQDKKYSTDGKEKYPVYTRETGTSFVYPETTGMTSADKTSRVSDDYATQSSAGEKYPQRNPDTIERQPEALYRVASESDLQYRNGESTIQGVSSQNSWHRIGSPMEPKKQYPMIEPGPRSLDLSKESAKTEGKKRSKRAAESVIQRISRKRTKKENDVENEIDFDDTFNDSKFSEQNLFKDLSTTTAGAKTTTVFTETTPTSEVTTTANATTPEEVKEASQTESTDAYDLDNDSTPPPPSGVSVLDVLKRLAQFKLRLGLNFLRSTTDLFSRYLDDIQRRVDESFANTTTTTVQYNKRKSPWSRIFFSRLNDDDEPHRRKRSVLENNQFLSAMLTAEHDVDERFSKSTKKDLRLSNKIFHQKKSAPKKYESKRTN